jgi:hypothetical protein
MPDHTTKLNETRIEIDVHRRRLGFVHHLANWLCDTNVKSPALRAGDRASFLPPDADERLVSVLHR